MIEKIQLDGSTLMDITTRQWHQCPELVRNYLDNVTYDPSDYSTSQIANYAPATAVVSNTKPIGNTVNGTTYYNEVPNVATPIVSGAVQPLDSLRWINTATENVRDLGGWACDGGTVKYGKLVRGGECVSSDKSLMVDTIGIKHELQLRGISEAPRQYSLWGVDFTCPTNYVWMSITDKTTWKEVIKCVFDNVIHEKPLYFHCAAGADRTGTIAVMLEALLGMSQSDIDKDYELTCFYSGTGTDVQARRRNEAEYQNYITAIKAVQLEGGLADTFRNRAVSFVLSLGFTISEINAFRTAMINGNPTEITVSMDSYTITKSGNHVSYDNNASAINRYNEYLCNIEPNIGYLIDDITITMGGVNITEQVFDGKFVVYGSEEITTNGEHDVSDFEKVNVNVSSGTQRTISKTLGNSTSNNSQTTVLDGQSYGAVIIPSNGYEITGITVTMGGTDISESVLTMI